VHSMLRLLPIASAKIRDGTLLDANAFVNSARACARLKGNSNCSIFKLALASVLPNLSWLSKLELMYVPIHQDQTSSKQVAHVGALSLRPSATLQPFLS